MSPHNVENGSLAVPYLQLTRSVFPEGREPDANGFIALSRRDFRESITRKRQELDRAQIRIPGDEQLLTVLSTAGDLKTVAGLGILTRPGEGILWESLEFRSFEASNARNRQAERLSSPIGRLDATLHASDVRLSVVHMFSFSSKESPLDSLAAVEIQQSENGFPEEMRELGMGHPGEQPFQLQYLIRFD